MIGYYVRLALKSLRRNPGLTTIMVCAVALGIAVCVVTITVYHAMSGNPIWWKNNRLYAVTMDSWEAGEPFNTQHPDLPPPQLSYKDAKALFASSIPERKVIMTRESGVLSGGTAQRTPQPVFLRVTTGDFFPMFDVPFLYGGGWSARDDVQTAPVIVLSRAMNDKLFGGANSVGRTIQLGERAFRIVGVMDRWYPVPKFYDLTTGAFDRTEDAFIPFSWIPVLQTGPSGDEECWNPGKVNSFRDFLASDCIWTQMWVELPDRSSRERMQAFIEAYWTQQHAAGRFPRPRNNRLTNVSHWLADNDVVSNDNRVLVGLSLAFLVVCVINTAGILLAKFLGRSTMSGVRRALGASRREIVLQHIIEAGLLSVAGALVGLGIAALGLLSLHALYADPERGGYQELAHFDVASIVAAVALAIASALAAGIYPAWRIGRVRPAVYLKNQ